MLWYRSPGRKVRVPDGRVPPAKSVAPACPEAALTATCQATVTVFTAAPLRAMLKMKGVVPSTALPSGRALWAVLAESVGRTAAKFATPASML